MVGKRVRKKKMRAPAVLLLLAAMSVLLPPVGPRGVAADSPLSSPAEPVLEEQPESTATEVRTMPEETAGQDVEAAEKPDTQPFSPVPESGPVEDTYFDDAAFLGDSRTEGFHLYSGLKTGRITMPWVPQWSLCSPRTWRPPRGRCLCWTPWRRRTSAKCM